MNRRHYLSVFVGSVVGLSGCSSDVPGEQGQDSKTMTYSPTPTPATTQTDTPEPAQFTVVSIDMPKEVEIGEKFTPKITVVNIGERKGTLRAPLYLKQGNSWQKTGVWVFPDVEPNERKTVTPSGPWQLFYNREYQFRLSDFDKIFRIRVTPFTSKFGHSYINPKNVKMVVSSSEFKSSYTRQIGDREDIQDAPDGSIFLFIQVSAKNTSDTAVRLPHHTEWHVITENREYEPEWDGYKEGRYEGGEVQPGTIRDGYLFYKLPENIRENIRNENWAIIWSESYPRGQATAYWVQL